MTDTATNKYRPQAGRADRLPANTPDIVIGAKQFPNPHHYQVHADTDTNLPVHYGKDQVKIDVSNPPAMFPEKIERKQ